MSRRLYKRCFLLLFLSVAGTALSYAQDRWDRVLDRYDDICNRCIQLRERVQAGETVSGSNVTPLLQELDNLRKTLQDGSGAMSAAQKERFRLIQERYRAASMASPYPGREPARAPLQRVPATPSVPEPVPAPSQPRENLPALAPPRPLLLSVPLESGSAGIVRRETPPEPVIVPDKEILEMYVLGKGLMSRELSYGLFAAVREGSWGAYLSGYSNFVHASCDYLTTSAGDLDGGGKFWGNGADKWSALTVTAGALWHPLKRAGIYVGAGYGRETLAWQDVTGEWAKVSDYSFRSVVFEAGFLLDAGRTAFAAGFCWSEYPCLCFGAGIHF